MRSRRIAYALLLAGMCAFWIYYDGWISVFFLFVTLLLPLFSLLISLPFAGKMTVRAGIPDEIPRGTDKTLTFSLFSRKKVCRLPGRIRVTLVDLMEGRKTDFVFLTPAVGVLYFHAAHSGVWRLEVRRAQAYDFLGLFSFRASAFAPLRLNVYPIASPPVPAPDFSALKAPSVRPKPGGGFSEIHELREYRPGDPMRSIHWKASAKMDAPIVREAEEVMNRRILLTYAMPTRREEADRLLDRMLWTSEQLLSMEIPHRIAARDSGAMAVVECREDLLALLAGLMSTPMPSSAPAESAKLPPSDWTYALVGEASSDDSGAETPSRAVLRGRRKEGGA